MYILESNPFHFGCLQFSANNALLFHKYSQMFRPARRLCARFTQPDWPLPFHKVLVANRGEIACRVLDSCRTLGVKTVAVYSKVDQYAKHVQMADEAICVGQAAASESYLNASRILQAAVDTGAQAIHPGYGFLSENVRFAELCGSKNVKFIGPPIAAIEAMGSKSASKRIMEAAGVPCIPGYHGDTQDELFLYEKAKEIGFPVMLKAVLGGGGKGMRIVKEDSESGFKEALDSCKREAKASFNDDRVLIERYVERPRHIEFQVFADSKGNCVHLMERDCSVQRRHQKVLEEAPAPVFSQRLRDEMGEKAVMAAKAVGYEGAGTVEFILDPVTNEFFFMEMNTRLQVEHPISEMITGYDFVQLQLHVASGHALPMQQHDISSNGHAIEARIYAEDPYNGFLPGSGLIEYMNVPKESEYIRVDSGIRQGDQISIFYDPMIAKLISWAPSRELALKGLDTALKQYHISGLPTNIEFLQNAAKHEKFIAGNVDTSFIGEFQSELLQVARKEPIAYQLAAASLVLGDSIGADHLWGGSFRNNFPNASKMVLDAVAIKVEYRKQGFSMTSEMWEGPVEVLASMDDAGHLTAFVDGVKHTCSVCTKASKVTMFLNGNRFTFDQTDLAEIIDQHTSTGEKQVKPPMPGRIVKVFIEEGQKVKKGDTVLVMEAMKMEHAIKAPFNAVVSLVSCVEGDFVDPSQTLFVFTAE